MKPIERLLSKFNELVPLTIKEEKLIADNFKPRKLKKKEILLFKGDTQDHLYFIAEGCLRTYYLDEESKEHNVQFGMEGWWIGDLYSYLQQRPARQFIQAIEKSTILQLHKDKVVKLFDESHQIERYFRLLFQNAYCVLQERMLYSLSKTAEERYEEFRIRYRDLEQRIPQYMVASYLGITPEFLSKLRKNLTQKSIS